MIKEYNNGTEFLNENSFFLDQNRYMSSLFYVDSKVLKEVSKINYAFKNNKVVCDLCKSCTYRFRFDK